MGPVNVQTGPQWSVSVFDFINIQQKPNGGVNVVVQAPAILGTTNAAKSSLVADDDSKTYQHKRRRRNVGLVASQEMQENGPNRQLISKPNSMQSAGEDERTPKEQTIKIGKDWAVDFGEVFKIKQKPGGGIDIQFEPSKGGGGGRRRGGGGRGKGKGGGAGGGGDSGGGTGGGEDPNDDPSVDTQKRRRRALDFWVSKLDPRKDQFYDIGHLNEV
ncbi:hypothetical protein C0J52_15999 [Blattella germanica]|nr:hypothetical protein C0J52_15999 [Blattella germanica]